MGGNDPSRRKIRLRISGMDCPDCAATVEKGVAAARGVSKASVDFMSGTLTVYGAELSVSELSRVVKALGYSAEIAGDSHVRKSVIRVPDMDCPVEEKTARQALQNLVNVHDIQVDIVKRELTVSHSGPVSDVMDAIRKTGLNAVLKGSESRQSTKLVPTWKLWSVIAAALITLVGAMLHFSSTFPWVYRPLLLAAMILAGWQIAHKGAVAARRLRLDMNFLMTAAVIGAVLIGQWLEAAVVFVLFSIAQLLESYSLQGSRNAIRRLMDLSPRTATVIRDNTTHQVPIDEVRVGDRVLVKPGDSIPVDGRVMSGFSAVNESTITGESVPVDKSPDATVYAGTLNGEGAIEIETTRAFGDTTLDRIIKLVEEAQTQRAPSQSFVDKFSTYYTPVVVVIAVLIGIIPPLAAGGSWAHWIYRSLALLVIACPCALVISTPVTIVSALANAARNGVLIKGGIFVENAHRLAAVAFDKTGTITRGNSAVSEVVPLNGADRELVLSLAASVESHSEHPIAKAIIHHAKHAGVEILAPRDFKSIGGKGACGFVDGQEVYIGKHALFEELGPCSPVVEVNMDRIEASAQTAVLVGTREKILGIIALADEIRPDSAAAVASLKLEGIDHVALLTGDNQLTAEAVGKAVRADEIYGQLLPDEKVKIVKSLRSNYGNVAMVGDGVNDAPALAAATMGIAMGAAGSDTALETADIALMADELAKIPWTIRLSRKTHQIIVQNIGLSIAIKFVFVVLASLGMATLWMAVFADMGVSLMVIFNGMRALQST